MKTAVVCQTLVKFNMFTFFISYTMPFIVFSLNEWAENTKKVGHFQSGGEGGRGKTTLRRNSGTKVKWS